MRFLDQLKHQLLGEYAEVLRSSKSQSSLQTDKPLPRAFLREFWAWKGEPARIADESGLPKVDVLQFLLAHPEGVNGYSFKAFEDSSYLPYYLCEDEISALQEFACQHQGPFRIEVNYGPLGNNVIAFAEDGSRCSLEDITTW